MRDYLIGIDMATENKEYLPPPMSNALFKEYGIPTAPVMGRITPKTLQELYDFDETMIKQSYDRGREGSVGKTNDGEYRWKSKHYTAKGMTIKIRQPRKPRSELPFLPDQDVISNLDKVYMALGKEDFFDKAKAMPMFAQLCSKDQEKDGYGPPERKLFAYYLVMEKKLREE